MQDKIVFTVFICVMIFALVLHLRNKQQQKQQVKERENESDEKNGFQMSVSISTPKTEAMKNPVVKVAESLKYDDPGKAVELYMEAAAEEEGLYSVHQACICYRRMKAYDKERELILQIIEVCKDEGMLDSIDTYKSRLQTVETLIAKQNKK